MGTEKTQATILHRDGRLETVDVEPHRTEFNCSECGQHKVHVDTLTTGYGVFDPGTPRERKVCFECSGKIDSASMKADGKFHGYLVKRPDGWHFTNWPGTLDLKVDHVSKGDANIGGSQTHFWLRAFGSGWYGRQVGDFNQCATVRRLKPRKGDA